MTEKQEVHKAEDVDSKVYKITSKSNDPIWWLSFGLSGTFNAFVLPIVILIIGVFPFIGVVDKEVLMWLFGSRFGSFLIVIVALMVLWNSLARLKYLLHDLKIPLPYPKVILFGCVGGSLTVLTITVMVYFPSTTF